MKRNNKNLWIKESKKHQQKIKKEEKQKIKRMIKSKSFKNQIKLNNGLL